MNVDEMSLDQIRISAFGKWCQDKDDYDLARYFFQCLRDGDPRENIAWRLLELTGADSVKPETLLEMVNLVKSGRTLQ